MKIKLKEKLLIGRVRKNDNEAFGRIYDEYIKKIYRYVFFRVPTQETAEDISQDVFTDLLDYLLKDKSKKIDNLQALIYQLARNKIADYYRNLMPVYDQPKNETESGDEIEAEEGSEMIIGNEINLGEKIDQKINLEILGRHLKEMSNQDFKEIILLKYVEEMDYKEIAKIMDKEVNAIRVLLHRAINELKKKIAQELENNNLK